MHLSISIRQNFIDSDHSVINPFPILTSLLKKNEKFIAVVKNISLFQLFAEMGYQR
jgi:hypothetical protein